MVFVRRACSRVSHVYLQHLSKARGALSSVAACMCAHVRLWADVCVCVDVSICRWVSMSVRLR
eukprot:4469336-Alexandrium_andersonii.AAC.1